jgi:hypothetical protein
VSARSGSRGFPAIGPVVAPLIAPSPDARRVIPTNRKLDTPGCLVFTLRDGKVVEQRHYSDLATLMRQLGLDA